LVARLAIAGLANRVAILAQRVHRTFKTDTFQLDLVNGDRFGNQAAN
jgi:hypothetical protein